MVAKIFLNKYEIKEFIHKKKYSKKVQTNNYRKE